MACMAVLRHHHQHEAWCAVILVHADAFSSSFAGMWLVCPRIEDTTRSSGDGREFVLRVRVKVTCLGSKASQTLHLILHVTRQELEESVHAPLYRARSSACRHSQRQY